MIEDFLPTMSGDTYSEVPDYQELRLRSDSRGDVASEISSFSHRSSLFSHVSKHKSGPHLEGNLKLFDTM